jgi:hypothetical protein
VHVGIGEMRYDAIETKEQPVYLYEYVHYVIRVCVDVDVVFTVRL